jgi:hypothetical protein
VTVSRTFRAISIVALMAALLLLYRIHPIAGWTTLAVLLGGAVIAHRHKETVAVRE